MQGTAKKEPYLVARTVATYTLSIRGMNFVITKSNFPKSHSQTKKKIRKKKKILQ